VGAYSRTIAVVACAIAVTGCDAISRETGTSGADTGAALWSLLLAVVLAVGLAVTAGRRRRTPTATRSEVPRPVRDWGTLAREVDSQVRWIHDHLDEDLAEWQARRGGRLVEPGRLASQDLDWARLQRLRPQVQELLDDLQTRAPDDAERDLARRLAGEVARYHASFDAVLRQVVEANGAVTDAAERMTSSRRLQHARTELAHTLGVLEERLGPAPAADRAPATSPARTAPVPSPHRTAG
jgi:hypothetical protein